MNKHTPGPWKVETVTTTCGICHKVGPFPGQTENSKPRHACLYSDYNSESNPADIELLANARLIAAAPDLLRYLKEARRTLEMWKDVAPAVSLCADIDAAIAKATGEQP